MRALLPAIAALAVVAGGCGGGEQPPPVPQGRHVSATRSLTPKAHLFGEPVVARVEVIVDRERLDPARVRVKGVFAPYQQTGAMAVERRDFARYTRLRYRVTLRCLTIPCLPQRVDLEGIPYRDQRVFRFKPAHVYYDDPATQKARHLRRVWWPSLEGISNLDLTDPHIAFQQFPGRVTLVPLPEATYRISPPLLAGLLLLAAAALLAFPALLAVRWLRSRRPPPPPEGPPLPPLERALLLVEWARDRVDGEDRRKAVEALAFELDAVGQDELAGAARHLAWSQPSPTPEGADELVRSVRGAG